MSDSPSPSPIDAYLDRALAAWRESGVLPDADELRAIAEDVEMTAAESEEADRRSIELTEEARGLIEEGDDVAAEELLRQAVVLSPIRITAHFLLAEIYGFRYAKSGEKEDRLQAIELAQHVQKLAPNHTPSHTLLEQLGLIREHAGISWKHAALIVLFVVGVSGTMSLCVRYTMVPDVPPDATEEVREYFEENPPSIP